MKNDRIDFGNNYNFFLNMLTKNKNNKIKLKKKIDFFNFFITSKNLLYFIGIILLQFWRDANRTITAHHRLRASTAIV